MRFELTDDQQDFAASLDALLTAADTPAVARAWADGDHGPGLAVWKRLADQGLTSLATEATPVELPFTTRDGLDLSRRGDELVLQVGGWRRTLLLPRALVDAPTESARMDDGTLRITFQAPERARPRGGRR